MLGEGPARTMDTLPPPEPQLDTALASGGRHRIPVVVVVSLAQGQRQRQAGLPFQLLLLRAVLGGRALKKWEACRTWQKEGGPGTAWWEQGQGRGQGLGTVGQEEPRGWEGLYGRISEGGRVGV